MPLEGKGFYMWKIHRCENGDAGAIVRRALDAGLTHVLVKIADGPRAYNVDLAMPVIEGLKGAGIQAWGWQFVYGNEPFGEADIAVHRIRTLGLDGFTANAEVAYKGKYAEANVYMDSLRARVNIPIALSSFRYPHYHPTLPWVEFLSGCAYNMPQVYWVQADNPAQQLDRCMSQFQEIYPVVPIIPTGAAYEEFGWRPHPTEVAAFLQYARDSGLPAANFWSWDYAGSTEGRDLWDVIANFDWPTASKPVDLADRLISALNRADIDAIVSLYQPNAVQVTAQRTISGQEALGEYYTHLLGNELPNATFSVEARVNEGNIRHLRWKAHSATNGKSVRDGQDTLGLRQGLIHYHSSVYHILSRSANSFNTTADGI